MKRILTVLVLGLVLCTSFAFSGQLTQTVTFTREDLEFGKFEGYDLLTSKGCDVTGKVGEPQLPMRGVYVSIPVGAEVTGVEIVSSDREELPGTYNIYPTQPPRPTSLAEDREVPFVEPDLAIYRSSIPYPGELIESAGTGSMGGYTVASFLVHPVHYIPSEQSLQFYSRIQFLIHYKEGTPSLPVKGRTERTQRLYRDKVKRLVINPEDVGRNGPDKGSVPLQPVVEYVIITTDPYVAGFQTLADWKTRKGVPAEVKTVSWIAVSYPGWDLQEKIRNFIIDYYQNYGLVWVLLGGDYSVVPSRSTPDFGLGPYGNIVSDLYYSDLDGTWDANGNHVYGETVDNVDMYADVFVGRASVDNPSQVCSFVYKVTKYEKDPPADYVLKMLLMGFDLDPWTYYEQTKDLIDNNHVPPRFDPITKIYDSQPGTHKAACLAALNAGHHLTNHGDHGSPSSMGVGSVNHGESLSNSDMDGLSNGDKQSILWAMDCLVAAFDFEDCIAEHFHNNPGGGGVAFVGNSRYGWYWIGQNPQTGLSAAFDISFFKSLFPEDFYRIGQTLADSKDEHVGTAAGDIYYRYIEYELTLLGDPEMPMWTDTPKVMTVIYPGTAPVGSGTFKVKVSYAGSPIVGALVCVEKEGEVYDYAYTDASGRVFFSISPETAGTMYVTVTAHNYIPHQGQAEIIPGLDIVEQWLSGIFVPPNPWDQPGMVELSFKVTAVGGDLTHVRLFSDALQHREVPKKIHDYLVEFVPEEIGFLGSCDTASIMVKVEIPMGQYWGGYFGYFRAVACNGSSDSVAADIFVEYLPDLDIDDDHGNLVGNTMELEGLAGSAASGTYIMVNPNMWESNVDLYDGPGNIDLDSISYHCTDLISYGGTDTIPSGNVNPNVRGIYFLPHSDAAENAVEITIPAGRQIGTVYTGTVTVTAQPGNVSDYFTLKVTVAPAHGPLIIIEDELPKPDFYPPNPWVQPGVVDLVFTVTAIGDLTHVRFFSDPLLHDSLDKKISSDWIEFIPEEIGFFPQYDTVQVTAKVQIPIGQHEGEYEGYFRAVSCQGKSDEVLVGVSVHPLADMDIQDYADNMVGNEMLLTGCAQSIVVGSFDLINPNMMDNNVDLFDGPGNVTIENIAADWHDLWSYGGNHRIDESRVSVLGLPGSLLSGCGKKVYVQVDIPQTITPREKTYSTAFEVTGQGDGVDVMDEFTLRVTVVPKGDGGKVSSGFWGTAEDGQNLLEWTEFGFGEVGYNLYRRESSMASFSKLNPSPFGGKSYPDANVFSGVVYEYQLGLLLDDGNELLLGPLSVRAAGAVPLSYALHQNYPNPFAQQTDIRFQLPVSSHTTLSIYDAAGRLVRTLIDGAKEPGYYLVDWDGRDETGRKVSTGVYFCRLQAGDFARAKRMAVLK